MKRSLITSLLFHGAVATVAYLGLPSSAPNLLIADVPIVVEIVHLAEETNAPPPAPAPEERVEVEPAEPEPDPPPPEPPKAEVPPPPEPEPVPEEAALPPEPEPEPEPETRPEPEPEPDPKEEPAPVVEPKPKPPERLAQAKPRHKPKPPDAIQMALQSLEELKAKPPPRTVEESKSETKAKAEPTETLFADIAKALKARPRHRPSMRPLSIGLKDQVRRQIEPCWNVPAGAKDARDLVIVVKVTLRPDGTVSDALIEDMGRYRADPVFRAAAESARRAVLNPRCQPFKLPPEQYELWRLLTLNFNPREMFGA